MIKNMTVEMTAPVPLLHSRKREFTFICILPPNSYAYFFEFHSCNLKCSRLSYSFHLFGLDETFHFIFMKLFKFSYRLMYSLPFKVVLKVRLPILGRLIKPDSLKRFKYFFTTSKFRFAR